MDVTATIALAGVAVLVAALVFLHAARTGLSPVRDPVSGYALTRHRAAYAVAAGAAAVSGLAVALLCSQVPGTGPSVGLLVTFAVARALIPFFPMDAPDAGRSPSGRVHSVLAILAFATVTAAAFWAAGPLSASHPTLSAVSGLAGIVMAVGSAGVIAGFAHPAARSVFGLAERVIYLGFLGWFAAVAFLIGRS